MYFTIKQKISLIRIVIKLGFIKRNEKKIF